MEDNTPEQPDAKKLSNADRLAKKKAQREALDKQIRQMENQEKERKRKRENKQNFLFGAAVREEAVRNPDFKKLLYNLMQKFLTREYDRSFFSDKEIDPFVLPPLPEKNDNKDDKKGG